MQALVAPLPKTTLSRRAYKLYWRLVFLTRKKVRFKNLYNQHSVLTGIVVYSTELPISPCQQHMLFSKGYPVQDKLCKSDTCATCTNGHSLGILKGAPL